MASRRRNGIYLLVSLPHPQNVPLHLSPKCSGLRDLGDTPHCVKGSSISIWWEFQWPQRKHGAGGSIAHGRVNLLRSHQLIPASQEPTRFKVEHGVPPSPTPGIFLKDFRLSLLKKEG
jgi:hypothetical protein